MKFVAKWTVRLMSLTVLYFVLAHQDWQRMYDVNKDVTTESLQSTKHVAKPKKASPHRQPSKSASHGKVMDVTKLLEEALLKYASKDGVIILSSVDSGYIDMTLNFYETSLQEYQLDNYLFVASDAGVCSQLEKRLVHCLKFAQDKDGQNSSNYGSAAFKRKTHFKTKIVHEALGIGLTVLLTDVDIVYLKNPLEHFHCDDCDIQIQNDGSEANSGFYLVRPTKPSIALHERAWDLAKRHPGLSNQKALDRTMDKMIKAKEIKCKLLSNSLFPNGQVYFEAGRRMFQNDNPCKQCVLVHNNWIVSGAAKAFRFKEMGLWQVDNDQYYSSPKRKYIAYGNPVGFSGKTIRQNETDALKAALLLGHILKRVVILPKFSCHGCNKGPCLNKNNKCSIYTFFLITKLNAQLAGSYRENNFLIHKKVPVTVREQSSPPLVIEREALKGSLQKLPAGAQVMSNKKTSGMLVLKALSDWLAKYNNASVLEFYHLYNLWPEMRSDKRYAEVVTKIDKAFVKGTYRQYQ